MTYVTGQNTSVRFGESTHCYDGDTSCVGTVDLGLVTKVLAEVERDPYTADRTITRTETVYGTYGLPTDVTAGGGLHVTEIVYTDTYLAYVKEERVDTGDPGFPELVSAATWDEGFGVPLTATDPAGVVTSFDYDEFGRLIEIMKPTISGVGSSTLIDYSLGSPLSHVRVRDERVNKDTDPLDVYTFVDGLGRERETKTWTGTQWVLAGYVEFDARGFARDAHLPEYKSTSAFEVLTAGADGWSTTTYDAWGRPLSVLLEDRVATVTSSYSIDLVTTVWDEEDSDVASPHYDTPSTSTTDGHGRVLAVDREIDVSGVPTTHTTSFEYDPLDDITKVTLSDAASLPVLYTYDSLGRMVEIDHPDSGPWRLEYDDADQLIETEDPRLIVNSYTWDLAGRLLTEDWNDDASDDVVYHYDVPWDDVNDEDPFGNPQSYTAGRLAWVTDASGGAYFHYDERGRMAGTTKDVLGTDYRSKWVYDLADRMTEHFYPDTTSDQLDYDHRSLLIAVRAWVNDVTYNASGLIESIEYDDDPETVTTYSYDERLRLTGMETEQTAAPSYYLIDWVLDLDAVGNVVDILDMRDPMAVSLWSPNNLPFDLYAEYDDFYRIVEADYSHDPGSAADRVDLLEYDWDLRGNLTLLNDDLDRFWERSLGDQTIVSGRLFRLDTADNSAYVSAGNEDDLVMGYDAAGNVTSIDITYDAGASTDNRTFTWDELGRLETADVNGVTLTWTYDYAGVAIVVERDDGVNVTDDEFPFPSYEVQDVQVVKYVHALGRRIGEWVSDGGNGRPLSELRELQVPLSRRSSRQRPLRRRLRHRQRRVRAEPPA